MYLECTIHTPIGTVYTTVLLQINEHLLLMALRYMGLGVTPVSDSGADTEWCSAVFHHGGFNSDLKEAI